LTDPYWKPAGEVTPKKQRRYAKVLGDYLVLPRIEGKFAGYEIDLRPFTTPHGYRIAKAKGYPISFPLNEDTAWLLGLYVAEGCSYSECAQFSLGRHEAHLVERVCGVIRQLGYKPQVVDTMTATAVRIPSRILSRAFRIWCGYKAIDKHIPIFILYHRDEAILRAFLKGYFEGDGDICTDTRSGKPIFRATTVSEVLTLQLQLLCAHLGFLLKLCKIEQAGDGIILGRWVKLHDRYIVYYHPNLGRNISWKLLGNYILTPIRSVKRKKYRGMVCNLMTEDET